MTTGRLKARAVGDLTEARQRNKGGDGGYALTVRPDSELVIRFLDEPDEWTEFLQHYMEEAEPRAFPCNDGDCVGCDAGNKPSKKWAARVIDVTEGKVRVFVMVKQVWEKLTGRRCFDKFHTILDRNYTIIRTGSTKNDTDYDVDPDVPSKIRLSKYQADIDNTDVEEFLLGQIPSFGGDSKSSSRTGKKATPAKAAKRRVVAEEEDDEVPWEEEDDRPPRRRSTIARKPASARTATKAAPRKAAGRPVARRRMS